MSGNTTVVLPAYSYSEAIMAAPVPAVFFFTNQADYGWTERHWMQSGLTVGSITASVSALSSNRVLALANDCNLLHVRVGTSNPRQPITVDISASAGKGQQPLPSSTDFVGALWLFKFQGVTYNRVFARGLPDDCLQADVLIPSSTYIQAFNAFTTQYLADSNFCTRQLANPNQAKVLISNLTAVKPRGFTFTCATGSFPKGSVLRVSGASTFGYNGQKTVVNVVTAGGVDTCQVGGATPPAPEDPSQAAFGKLLTYNILLPDTILLDKLVRRASGRPFGLRRGKATTRISLRQ